MALTPQPPLPAPPVQTPPLGWLGLLGIKSGGRQPGVVNPVLAPVQDMTEFYVAGGRAKLFSGSVAFVNNGLVTGATVPQGHVWIVEHTAVLLSTGVAAGIYARVVYTDSGGFPIYMGPLEPNIPASVQVHVRSDKRVVVGPGGLVSAIGSAAAAPTAFNYFFTIFGQDVLA
jgi:hypothetical protein